MSIHFISGKPGGGKSLYAMRLIEQELLHTERVVVTNIALRTDELNAYLQRKHEKKVVDLHSRIRILDEKETAKFWLHRGYKIKTAQVGSENVAVEWEKIDLTQESDRPGFTGEAKTEGYKANFSEYSSAPSVLYVIDEIHEYFNSRQWMSTGRGALYYLSQHRKMGDDVICITQSINNVDKQFRSVAQDFTYIRNHRKERYLYFFRSLPLFSRMTYLQPASGIADKPMEVGMFKLDVSGLAACYDTAAGVGIHGRNADAGERKKGIPIIIMLIVIFAGLFLLWWGPDATARAIAKSDSKVIKKSLATLTNTPASTNPSSMASNQELSGSSRMLPGQAAPMAYGISTNYIEVTNVIAFYCLGGHMRATLSNGKVYTERNGLQAVAQDFVMIEGRRYDFAESYLATIPPRFTNDASMINNTSQRKYLLKDKLSGMNYANKQ